MPHHNRGQRSAIGSATLAFLPLVAVLLANLIGISPARAAGERLNVLFIAVDDLKPRLGCYDDAEAITPNIDRLASRGLVFENAFVQQAVCGPSRASFLSGLRPDFTGVRENNAHVRDKRPDVPLLPRHFKDNGYRTVALGKIHHWDGDGEGAWSEPIWRPFNMGASTREYLLPESVETIRRAFDGVAKPSKKKVSIDTVKGPAWENADLLNDIYPDGLTAQLAVHTIERLAAGGQPFLLAVGFIKPHLPFACPKAYWDLYDPAKLTLSSTLDVPVGMPPVAFYDSEELRQYQGIPPPKQPIDEALQRRLMHGYLACTSYMDAQVGLLLEALDRQKLTDRTVVVLLGDHGWHLGDNGIWGKCTNFESAARAPLIMSVPGQATVGRKTPALVEMLDVYPTLADVCGLPLPKHLQGESLRPWLQSATTPSRPAAFSQYTRPGNVIGYSMRTAEWRYTRWVDANEKVVGEELYDIRRPDGERLNLAADPKNAETVKTLGDGLSAARARWKAEQGERRP